MADGSVVIGVGLDTAAFAAQSAALEAQIFRLAEQINSAMSTALNGAGLAASLNEAMTAVSSTFSSIGQTVTDTLHNAAASGTAEFVGAGWSEAGSSAASSLASGISAGGGAVSSAAGQIAGEALSAFSSGSFSSIGSEMMNGIAAGILASGASVVAAIRQVSAETEKAAKEYYKISSPSKLMHDEVGVMISRGIAEGILDGASFVGGAMSAVYGTPFGGGVSSGIYGSTAAAEPGRSVTQNIYLRDSDSSPYRTAKRIRRESEAIFR